MPEVNEWKFPIENTQIAIQNSKETRKVDLRTHAGLGVNGYMQAELSMAIVRHLYTWFHKTTAALTKHRELQSVKPAITINLEVEHKRAGMFLNVTFQYQMLNIILHVRNMQPVLCRYVPKSWSQNWNKTNSAGKFSIVSVLQRCWNYSKQSLYSEKLISNVSRAGIY